MTIVSRALAGLIASPAILLALAPTSSAAPDCSAVGKTVTYCETNGSTQIITSPPPLNYGGWTGISYWPLVGEFGLGPN